MPVYFIAQVQINDAAGYQAYQEAAAKAPFEGVKVLAMDDKPEVVEGTWSGPKTVIVVSQLSVVVQSGPRTVTRL